MEKLNAWMERRSRTSFILMLIVGAYLFYAVYQMYQGLPALTGSAVPVYIFMGLFVLAGAALLWAGAYALARGHYSEKLAEKRDAGDADRESGEEGLE